MKLLDLTSQVTFLNFNDLEKAKVFFDDVLKLEKAYDPGWACVWRTGCGAFVGGVDAKNASVKGTEKGGVLISLTVRNIDEVYDRLKSENLDGMSAIKEVPGIELKSFFFTGPEGYKFEIQQFTSDELKNIF